MHTDFSIHISVVRFSRLRSNELVTIFPLGRKMEKLVLRHVYLKLLFFFSNRKNPGLYEWMGLYQSRVFLKWLLHQCNKRRIVIRRSASLSLHQNWVNITRKRMSRFEKIFHCFIFALNRCHFVWYFVHRHTYDHSKYLWIALRVFFSFLSM